MNTDDNGSPERVIADNAHPSGVLPAGLLLGGLGILAFSFSLPMNKLAVAGIDAYTVTALRAALAGVLALAYLALRRPSVPGRHDVTLLMCSGMGVVVGFPLFSSLALERIDSATSAVINGLLPALTATFAALVGGERLPPLFWAATGAGVMVLITYLLVASPAGLLGFSLDWGYLWMVLATISGGFGYAAGGSVAKRVGGAQSISWSLVLLLPLSIPAAVLGVVFGTVSLTASVVAGMVYITVISQFLGFFAWYGGLARGGIARIGQIQQIQPLLTIVLSSLLLGEQPDAWIYVVGIVLGLLVWIAQRARFRSSEPPRDAEVTSPSPVDVVLRH